MIEFYIFFIIFYPYVYFIHIEHAIMPLLRYGGEPYEETT